MPRFLAGSLFGVPYEIATARTLLGQACRHDDDAAGAAVAFEHDLIHRDS
jgi:hypothetical protein